MASTDPTVVHVACLCAAWCRLCDAYETTFREMVGRLRDAGQAGLRLHWVDIEDEAALVGDLDIDTFPTLLIADGRQLRFAGAVEPQAATLERLLRSTLAPGAAAVAAPAYVALAARLRLRQPG